MIDEHDKRRIYCRILGHHLSFEYCRLQHNGLPCQRVLDCWFEHFPIQDFISAHYTEEQFDIFMTPPKDKMTSLYELIEKAKKRSK